MRLFLIFTFSAVLFFGSVYFAFGHGEKYLEFNPDSSSSLKVIEVETPAQTFTAQNDFLGGFDLWVSNEGPAGSATFYLFNEQGNTVSIKTLTVPTIPEISGGTRFHVDFPSQFAVTSYKKYTIKVVSSLPDLKIYYSDRIKLVSYNSPFVSEYLTGVGKLGSEEQTFSFKYALHEGSESDLPVVSNIVWTILSPSEMRVDFNANEPVDYRIEYGILALNYTNSTTFTGGYQFCASGVATCSLTVPVSSNTTYQYLLTVKDSWGNQRQAGGTFSSGQIQQPSPATSSPSSTVGTSLPIVSGSASLVSSSRRTADIAPPRISNLKVASVTDKSVEIAWTTNEAANSNLWVSFTTELIAIAQSFDSTFELEHLLKTDSVLNPGTPYLATITSRDLADNTTTASINFTTLAKAKVTPEPSSPTQLVSSSQPSGQAQDRRSLITITETYYSTGSGSALIEWEGPYLDSDRGGGGSYRIDIIDEAGQLKEKILVLEELKSIEVKNLPDGEYSVVVYKENNSVFEKVGQPVKLIVREKSFIERLQPVLLYIIIALGVLIFLAWCLFGRRSPQKL